MSTILWHNGNFLNSDQPIFTANDRIRLGDGFFDTILVIDGRAQHLTRHYKKLHDGADIFSIEPPLTLDDLSNVIQMVLSKNNAHAGHFIINVIISRGPSQRGLTPPKTPQIQTVIKLSKAPATFPETHAIIASKTRRNEHSPLSRVKSLSYGDNILAMMEAEAQGANDAILRNISGNIACTTGGNIFMLKDSTLITPPLTDGALNGVIRQMLIENHQTTERSLSPDDLKSAHGIFISNSIKGLIPLYSLNGKTLPTLKLPFSSDFHHE